MSSHRHGPSKADLIEEYEPLKRLLGGWIGAFSPVLELCDDQPPLSNFLTSDKAKDVTWESLRLEELDHRDGIFRAVLMSNLDTASEALLWQPGETEAFLQAPSKPRSQHSTPMRLCFDPSPDACCRRSAG